HAVEQAEQRPWTLEVVARRGRRQHLQMDPPGVARPRPLNALRLLRARSEAQQLAIDIERELADAGIELDELELEAHAELARAVASWASMPRTGSGARCAAAASSRVTSLEAAGKVWRFAASSTLAK